MCKSYNAFAINNLFLVNIISKKLKEKEWFKVFVDTVIEGFKKSHECEITNVQKKKEFDFAWIVAPSLKQAKKINTYKISLDKEIMNAKFANFEKLTKDDKAKKNVVILIAKNLNKVKSIKELEKVSKSIWERKM